jgi:hypothetical protein
MNSLAVCLILRHSKNFGQQGLAGDTKQQLVYHIVVVSFPIASFLVDNTLIVQECLHEETCTNKGTQILKYDKAFLIGKVVPFRVMGNMKCKISALGVL